MSKRVYINETEGWIDVSSKLYEAAMTEAFNKNVSPSEGLAEVLNRGLAGVEEPPEGHPEYEEPEETEE